VQALGGAGAIKAPNSRIMKGTLDVVGVSRGGSFEIYAQAPNKMLSVLNAHPLGVVKVGYNGRVGWSQSERGIELSKGAELEALRRDGDFYSPLNLKQNFTKVSLLGKSKIGYREVFVLELQPRSGSAEKLYLDAETYLPARMNALRMIGKVAVQVEIYLDDWRAVDGIKYPFRISQSSQGVSLNFTVTEIKHNVPVNASLFELPAK